MSSTVRPQRCTHLTMFCAALSAPVTMCTLASRRTPDMPMGSRMPSWPSMMNSCGSTCRMLLVGGNRHGLGRVDHVLHVHIADLAIADRHHAVRVQAAHMAAGDAGVHRVDLAAGHQLGLFDGALDRLHGGFDVHHHALLQAARRMRTQAHDLDGAVRRRSRRPGPRPWTCRCPGPRSANGRCA